MADMHGLNASVLHFKIIEWFDLILYACLVSMEESTNNMYGVSFFKFSNPSANKERGFIVLYYSGLCFKRSAIDTR